MSSNLSILILNGFGRLSAVTSEVLRIVTENLEQLGVETKTKNLFQLALPLFDGEVPWLAIPSPVKDLVHDIRIRHGVLMIAPEYHGGLGSVVKNAMDWAAMASSVRHQDLLLDYKPSAFVTVSSERNHGVHALNQMGALCHTLGSPVMPTSMGIYDQPHSISTDGSFSDIAVTRRLETLVSDLVQVAARVAEARGMLTPPSL